MTKPRTAALSLSLLTVLLASACGSGDTAERAADGAASASTSAAPAADADAGSDDGSRVACSLLTAADLEAATGRTFGEGEGTDYDDTCRFDSDDERVTVAVSDLDPLTSAKGVGTEVVQVAGLPGATRVDAVVYVERDGVWLSVGTALPGFAASERDAKAAEELAKRAAARL